MTAGDLLHDVWECGVKSPDTIRSAVRNLRKRLSEAGMDELAAKIRGTGGRYGLMLDGVS
jgi:DNA-binding winged helix-turn-helix (wHTH) protein